jgi:hypothetical protein
MSEEEVFANDEGEFVVEPSKQLKIVINQNEYDEIELYTYLNEYRCTGSLLKPITVFKDITDNYGNAMKTPKTFEFQPYRKSSAFAPPGPNNRRKWMRMEDFTLNQTMYLVGEKMHIRMCIITPNDERKITCIFDAFFVSHATVPESDVPYRDHQEYNDFQLTLQ